MTSRCVFPLLLVLELSGCATLAAPDPEGSPARVILAPLLTRRNPSAGILSIRREPGTIGEECRHRVFLDGNPVADLRPNEVVNIYALPGEHVLRVEQTGSSCHGGSEVAATSEKGRLHSFTTLDLSPNGALLTATAK